MAEEGLLAPDARVELIDGGVISEAKAAELLGMSVRELESVQPQRAPST